MRDINGRQAQLSGETTGCIQDAGAHRHIKHRDRLIRHQEIRMQDESPREYNALQLAAGQLMRVLIEESFGRGAS